MKHPKQLGPFRILQLLGRGGMGAVYQGIHATTGEPVAVKVLLDNFDEEAPDSRLRFEAEIEALRMLRHPSIVRLNGFGQEDELLYYVMELVCGTTLYKELKKKRGFLWQDVAKIGYEVCLALKHGHDRGITHRDLKPANIMLDNNGVVKIADYGIAHCFGNNRLTGSHAVIGTIEFMSPEQSVAGPVGPKSDIYSLGAVLYALLCRRPPFVAKTLPEIIKKHQNEPLEDISHFRHDAPVELVRVIRHMLERRPENRPNNAFLVAKRFEELLNTEFGSPDAVIVLPSKFEDPPAQTPTSDETRTAFLGNKKVGESVPEKSKGDSKSFLLQYDVSPDENAVAKNKVTADDADPAESKPADESQADDDSDEAEGKTPSKSLSVYHDLTNIPNSFSGHVTRQTSAFNYLKNDSEEMDSQDGSIYENLQPDTEGAHDSTSVSGHIQTVSTPRNMSKYISHFTAIGENELGYRLAPDNSKNRPFISVQVAVLSICLVMLGLWAWWMLQPPSADKVYRAIVRHVDIERMPPRQSAILAAESDITKFLELYSQDDRVETVLMLQKEVELAHMDRQLERQISVRETEQKLLPVQRAYLDAVALINTQPEEAVRRFEAVITLYETPRFDISDETNEPQLITSPPSTESQEYEPDLSNPISMTVEIARRRLKTLQGNVAPIADDQAEQLARTLERIKLIEKIDPVKAEEMRKAVIELYGNKTWAAKLLETLNEPQPANNVDVKEGIF